MEMGNCMGQRSIGGPQKGKENVPKTPQKGKDVEVLTKNSDPPKTPQEGKDVEVLTKNSDSAQKDATGENGSTVKAAEKATDNENNGKCTTNHKMDKNDELHSNSAPEQEKLSTSWVVFDDPDEKLNEKKEKATVSEEKPKLEKDTGEKVDDLSSKQRESREKEQIMKENSTADKTERPDGESLKNQVINTTETRIVENTVISNGEGKKDQGSKGQQQKEVKDTTGKEVLIVVNRPIGKDDTKKEDKNTENTGSSDKSDANTGKPESINVLHEVLNGRVIATKQTEEGPTTRNADKQENEEDKREKRLLVLKSKMEKYRGMKNSADSIIDVEQAMFVDEVLNRNLVLEDAFVSGREVSGLIALHCSDPHPKAIIRYTTDSWKTTTDEEAIPFTADKDDSELFQRFFFSLFVPFAKSLEFAVTSIGDFGTFWDNNNGKNYRVESVKEDGNSADLIAKFTPLKQEMFNDLVQRKSVTLKNALLRDGKVVVTIATKENSTDLLGIRYTLDNWKSFTDVTNVESKSQGPECNVSKIRLDIPKEAKMVFAIFWRYGGIEYWDNNNGTNFEIHG